MKRSTILMVGFMVFVMAIVLVGTAGLPSDFQMDVEYLNGILTASSVLFGFWAVLMGTEIPKRKKERLGYERILVGSIFALSILVYSVIMVFFSAVDKVSPVVALTACMVSFMGNIFLLMATLYYTRIKEL